MIRKNFRNSLIRNSAIVFFGLVFLAVIGLIVRQSSQETSNNQSVVEINNNANDINPLSNVSKSQIAYQVASMTGIYESVPVENQAESQAVSQNVPVDDQLIAEPVILATSIKTREDVVKYVVQTGDTLSSLAIKYGVTSASIAGSNGITDGKLVVGTTIYIPPVNGIVYTVKAGDTPQSLATTYKATASDIISFNDAELTGLQVGERIVIPNGTVAVPVATYYSTTADSYTDYGYNYGVSAIYGGNGYDYGECTWFVANKRAEAGDPIPSNLGDAYSWYYLAQEEGIPTGLNPQVGAVMWFPSSYVSPLGHVAYVESVNADGSVTVSEMNWVGWDVVDYRTIPADQLAQNRYIY